MLFKSIGLWMLVMSFAAAADLERVRRQAGSVPVIGGIDECASNPCQNGARCVDGDKKYTCICSRGYYGCQCDFFDVDECSSNPCQNGGTCVDGNNEYICVCPPNTLGPLCEISNDVCQNAGQLTCSCPTNYTGQYCQEPVLSQCNSSPCANGGICTANVNGYTCQCPRGYLGSRCQLIDYCSRTPCMNGGICTSRTTSFSCSCPLPYTGARCETVNDPCRDQPCGTNGICVPEAFAFYCRCTNGFTGDRCRVAPVRSNMCYSCTTASFGPYVCSLETIPEPTEPDRVQCVTYCVITKFADGTISRGCADKANVFPVPEVPIGGSVCKVGPNPGDETCFCGGDLCNIAGFGTTSGGLNGGISPTAGDLTCTCGGPPCGTSPYKCMMDSAFQAVHCDCGTCGCSYTKTG